MGFLGFNRGYGYDDFSRAFGDSEIVALFALMFGFIAIFVIIAWAVGLAVMLVLYILRSIGLYKLSENRGMSGAGLAWIPFIGSYRIGSIADDIVAKSGGKSYYRYFLLIGRIVGFAAGFILGFFMGFRHSALSQHFDSPYASSRNWGGYADYSGEVLAYWGISFLLFIMSITLYVLTVIALNKIYHCYRPASSTSWTVLSVIFPFMQSIFPFVIRNAVPASEWGAQGYYPVQYTAPNQNWQAPPPYPHYGQQPPVNGYPAQNQEWQPSQPPANAFYQPPAAPNPPEPWEIEDSPSQPPPKPPWERDGNGDS